MDCIGSGVEMIEKKIVVGLAQGLHARPATEFVKAASSFTSNIKIEKGARKVEGKSILGVMSLAVAKGDEITLYADGVDAERAIAALEEILVKE
jgi:catabolite repression HPr-like protein